MVLAAHIIFSAYGFWLPNDPRGSWSEFVASWELLRFDPLEQYSDPEGKVPSCWSGGLWKVYADTNEDVIRMIDYVERNPEKEGKPQQRWSFVSEFVY